MRLRLEVNLCIVFEQIDVYWYEDSSFGLKESELKLLFGIGATRVTDTGGVGKMCPSVKRYLLIPATVLGACSDAMLNSTSDPEPMRFCQPDENPSLLALKNWQPQLPELSPGNLRADNSEIHSKVFAVTLRGTDVRF